MSRIALVDPRKVLVPLKDAGKRDGHYLVPQGVREFLEARGWRVVGAGNQYLYVVPPQGVKKPFRLPAEIPTREQVEQIANELHTARQQWSGYVGEWWTCYLQPEPRGERETFAHFAIGHPWLWAASVAFTPDGPQYRESTSYPPA